MSSDSSDYSLVIARPRCSDAGAEVLLRVPFDENGFGQILEAKRHIHDGFPAVLSPDGHFAILPTGLVFDPTRKRPGGGTSDAERVLAAREAADALFREPDGFYVPEVRRLLLDICSMRSDFGGCRPSGPWVSPWRRWCSFWRSRHEATTPPPLSYLSRFFEPSHLIVHSRSTSMFVKAVGFENLVGCNRPTMLSQHM